MAGWPLGSVRATCSWLGGVLAAAGLFWLSFIQAGDTYWTGACGGGILATFGMGLAFTPIALLATGGRPPAGSRPGVGSGQLQPPDRRLGGAGRTDHRWPLRRRRPSSPPDTHHTSRGATTRCPVALTEGYARAFLIASMVVLAGTLLGFDHPPAPPGR